MVKLRAFAKKFRFAVAGITHTFKHEMNFRIQLFFAALALALLLFFRAAPVWWAVFFLVIGGVLASEILNTAVEALADALHPEQHPLIGRAKDCAAGAVLVWSFVSLCVLFFFIYSQLTMGKG